MFTSLQAVFSYGRLRTSGRFDGTPHISFRGLQPTSSLGAAGSSLEHDQGDGNALSRALDGTSRLPTVHSCSVTENADGTLVELCVLERDIDHQVSVNVTQAGHGAGGNHVEDHLLRRSGLHSR